MARFGADQEDVGRLEVLVDGTDLVGNFVPSRPRGADKSPTLGTNGIRLLRYSADSSRLSIFPTNTLEGTVGYLKPKYEQIHTITVDLDAEADEADLELILETLPKGFVKDYSYGLGLLKDCNRIVRLIEEHTACTSIAFTDSDEATVDGDEFRLGLDRFGLIWSEIQRINDRGNRAARRVKDAHVHNTLASALSLEPTEASLGRHPVSRLITMAADGVEPLTEEEQDALVSAVASESAAIARSNPAQLVKLQREIELVSLDQLIEQLATSLERRTNEGYWQTFFDDNGFALQQVFGAPMINVQSTATVGGGGSQGEATRSPTICSRTL